MKWGLMTNVKWMSTMVCMGGRRTKIGGSVQWHGEGVGGVTDDMDLQVWQGLFWTWKAWKWGEVVG
jgi:hypothetical protein